MAVPPIPLVTPDDLRELRSKYEEMRRMRLEDVSAAPPDPRAAMTALARRFPGALREIDDLPLDAIRARIEALTIAIDAPDAVAPWMRALVGFHRWMRGALIAKRWLAHVTTPTRDAFVQFARTADHPDDALLWQNDLARVAAPPRGKISVLVYEKLARALDVTDAEARRLTFGPSRRER